MTHRAIFSIAAGALLTVTVPSFAQSQGPLSNSSADSSPARAGDAANGNQRICVLQETTGTRIDRKVCRTRDEWNREGGIPTEESR